MLAQLTFVPRAVPAQMTCQTVVMGHDPVRFLCALPQPGESVHPGGHLNTLPLQGRGHWASMEASMSKHASDTHDTQELCAPLLGFGALISALRLICCVTLDKSDASLDNQFSYLYILKKTVDRAQIT